MLFCCNKHYTGSFSRVLVNNSALYRRVEFGTCPNCNVIKYREYIQFENGLEKVKDLSGDKAMNAYNKMCSRLKNTVQGSKTNQNVYYGDFKKTRRKDANGNPIYLQVRKNFNNQTEILNQIKTAYYFI